MAETLIPRGVALASLPDAIALRHSCQCRSKLTLLLQVFAWHGMATANQQSAEPASISSDLALLAHSARVQHELRARHTLSVERLCIGASNAMLKASYSSSDCAWHASGCLASTLTDGHRLDILYEELGDDFVMGLSRMHLWGIFHAMLLPWLCRLCNALLCEDPNPQVSIQHLAILLRLLVP